MQGFAGRNGRFLIVSPKGWPHMSAKGIAYTAAVALIVVVAYEHYKNGGGVRPTRGIRVSN